LSKTFFSEASFYCVDRCPGTPPIADAANKVEMLKAATAAARQACPATGIGGSCIGASITIRCAAVILGGKKPLVVLLTSNCADAAGVVVPIPTRCAMPFIVQAKKTKMVNPLCKLYRLWYLKYFRPLRGK
jgi:hypothetical protein